MREGISQSDLIDKLLLARRVAIVGVSDDPDKPSHRIAKYLSGAGYEIVPVNPNLQSVLGLRCYPSLRQIRDGIDLVNILRRPEFIPGLVSESIEIGAGGIWVQSGIRSAAAKVLAASSGINYVEDRCILVEHSRRT
jgi:predicted CoA-binding protein